MSSASARPKTVKRDAVPVKPKIQNPDLIVAEGAFVHPEAITEGRVLVGKGTIIHPLAKILAGTGDIVIGDGCIIEEDVLIENKGSGTLTVGNDNHLQVAAWVEGSIKGDHNVFGARCHVAADVIVSDYCYIGPDTTLTALSPATHTPSNPELIPPYTTTYGTLSHRRLWDGEGKEQQRDLREKHREYLGVVLRPQKK